MHDDDDDRALTPAERRRMEAEIATLEAVLATLERICHEALAGYEGAEGAAAENAAWRRYERYAEACDDGRARAAALRERLAADDTRADVAAWAADRGVR